MKQLCELVGCGRGTRNPYVAEAMGEQMQISVAAVYDRRITAVADAAAIFTVSDCR